MRCERQRLAGELTMFLMILLFPLMLLVCMPAHAQRPMALIGGPGGGSTGIQPFGNVPPPAGTQWVLTFDDEFNQDSSVNTSKVNIGHSAPATLTWPLCNGNGYAEGSNPNVDPLGYVDQLGWQVADNCNPQPGTFGTAPYLGIDPGVGLYIQSLIDYTIAPCSDFSCSWDMTQSWEGVQTYGIFSQVYGYFEVSAKEPSCASDACDGIHTDIWLTTNNRVVGNCCAEIDIAEKVMGPGNVDYVHCISNQVTGGVDNESDQIYPTVSVGDLSAAFHRYAVYWWSTGSGEGEYQCYFDGIPQGNPVVLTHPDFGTGVYFLPGFMQQALAPAWGGGTDPTVNTSNDDPFIIQYARAWQGVAP